MTFRVLSLDISASSTGWALILSPAAEKFEYGVIKTNPKDSEPQRLFYFRNELLKLLLKLKPSHVVMEDIYSGINVNTMKLLAKFAGVAEECCVSVGGIEPHIIHTTTVKSYFKAKTKEQLFDFVVELLGWESSAVFKKHNDIIDAVAQALVFCDKVIGCGSFRIETDYGFLYEV